MEKLLAKTENQGQRMTGPGFRNATFGKVRIFHILAALVKSI